VKVGVRAWVGIVVATGASCVIGPLDYTARPCTGTCPAGLTCEGRICVPDGGRFCDYAPVGATSCLDFGDGLPLDGGWAIEPIPGSFLRVENGTLVSEVSSSASGLNGRLQYPLPPWQHVRLSFDLKPQLMALSGFVAVSEIETQCGSDWNGAWFHYLQDTGPSQFVLRAGPGTQLVVLDPQPALDGWTRVTLETTAGTPNVGTVSLNGTSSGAVTFDSCSNPTTWVANLGLAVVATASFEHVELDNVVLEQKW
jgi:hypothetical protein